MQLTNVLKLPVLHYHLFSRHLFYIGLLATGLFFQHENYTWAQVANQPLKDKKTGKPAFQIFYEKVYLHLDRTVYTPGENIWFSAYYHTRFYEIQHRFFPGKRLLGFGR